MSTTHFPGILEDGSRAPKNSDSTRLDFISGNPGMLLNSNSGVRWKGINQWQASVRVAIDAGMETERQRLRAKGLTPNW